MLAEPVGVHKKNPFVLLCFAFRFLVSFALDIRTVKDDRLVNYHTFFLTAGFALSLEVLGARDGGLSAHK